MQNTIFILPCNGDSAAGRITRLAAQELVLAGRAQWCLSWRQIGKLLEKAGEDTSSFIIVDGCEKRCVLNQLLEEGLVGRHYLALSDVGIDITSPDDVERKHIELAKDAIIAECAPLKQSVPPPLAGCSCR